MRSKVAILFVMMILGAAAAQGRQSSHTVTVAIPNVLRFRLDDRSAAGRAEVPLTIEVAGGGYRITPAGTSIEVLANGGWQLSASYQPDGSRDGRAKLLWRTTGEWRRFTNYDRVILSGGATRGWQQTTISYGLDAPLPVDGTYRGVVTYTLTRP